MDNLRDELVKSHAEMQLMARKVPNLSEQAVVDKHKLQKLPALTQAHAKELFKNITTSEQQKYVKSRNYPFRGIGARTPDHNPIPTCTF